MKTGNIKVNDQNIIKLPYSLSFQPVYLFSSITRSDGGSGVYDVVNAGIRQLSCSRYIAMWWSCNGWFLVPTALLYLYHLAIAKSVYIRWNGHVWQQPFIIYDAGLSSPLSKAIVVTETNKTACVEATSIFLATGVVFKKFKTYFYHHLLLKYPLKCRTAGVHFSD